MTLLSPYALGFLALVPIIILFYILRAQYERIPVPSTLLWRNVVRDTEGRPTWRSPIRNILLLLQILAAILGALALTRPATLGQTARNHILILDASSSMQATDVAPSRFEAAKAAASDAVRAGQDGDTFALLRMGAAVDVVDKTDSKAQMLQSIAGLQPGVGGGDVRGALQVAGSIAREQPGYENDVTIFSDGNFDPPPPIDNGLHSVQVKTIGQSSDNQAVVSVRVRRAADGSNRPEGFARLMNYASTAVEVPVRSLADGVQVDSRRARIPARGAYELVVPLNQNVKLFEVNIDRQDALQLDNYAQVVVPSEDVEVTLVSANSQFLEKAIKALPNVKLAVVKPQQYKRDATGAITVFDNYLPRTRDNLPPGSMLIVNPPTGTGVFGDVQELKNAQQIVRINPRSPLLDSVDLSGVFLPKALKIKGPQGMSPAVESKEAPLVWEGLDEGRKTVMMGFDPKQPEIGQRLAFPMMLSNAIAWLAPNAGSPTLSPGQTINLQPLRDAKDIVVRDPSGKSVVFPITPANKGKAIPFSQTEQIGRYLLLQRGDKGPLSQSWFTVNGGDEQRSDVRPRTYPAQVAQNPPGSLLSAVNLELWPYVAGLVLVVLSAEWLVYARK